MALQRPLPDDALKDRGARHGQRGQDDGRMSSPASDHIPTPRKPRDDSVIPSASGQRR